MFFIILFLALSLTDNAQNANSFPVADTVTSADKFMFWQQGATTIKWVSAAQVFKFAHLSIAGTVATQVHFTHALTADSLKLANAPAYLPSTSMGLVMDVATGSVGSGITNLPHVINQITSNHRDTLLVNYFNVLDSVNAAIVKLDTIVFPANPGDNDVVEVKVPNLISNTVVLGNGNTIAGAKTFSTSGTYRKWNFDVATGTWY